MRATRRTGGGVGAEKASGECSRRYTVRVALASTGTTQPDLEGRQGDVGYKVGTSILPASVLPLFIEASRTTSTSAGDLGPSNPIRSGMIAPTGAPPVDFESLNKTLNLGWQLNLTTLPRLEIGYRKGSSIVTGGDYRAEQYDEDLSAVVTKDTSRTRQSLRYQQTSYQNVLAQTFEQELGNLDYDFGANLLKHLHVTAHGGRRSTFSRSAFASTVGPTDGAYLPPPSSGGSRAEYALAGVSFEPSGRFSIRLNGTVDRQTSDRATTNARLATMSSHVEVVRGLRLTASGITGQRGQIVADVPTEVDTRSAEGGISYQAHGGVAARPCQCHAWARHEHDGGWAPRAHRVLVQRWELVHDVLWPEPRCGLRAIHEPG